MAAIVKLVSLESHERESPQFDLRFESPLSTITKDRSRLRVLPIGKLPGSLILVAANSGYLEICGLPPSDGRSGKTDYFPSRFGHPCSVRIQPKPRETLT